MTKLQTIDIVAIVATLVGELIYAAALFFGRPHFAAEFRDMRYLPIPSELMMHGTFAYFLGALPLLLLIGGLIVDVGRTPLFLAGVVAAALTIAVFAVSMYLPFIAFTGNIN